MNEQINQNQGQKAEQIEKISSSEILNSQEINDLLQKISFKPLKDNLVYSADSFKSGETSEIRGNVRFEHQDDWGLYYANKFFTKELSKLEPKIKDVTDAFKRTVMSGLSSINPDNLRTSGTIPDFLLQVKALCFRKEDDFEKEVMTEENKKKIEAILQNRLINDISSFEESKENCFGFDSEALRLKSLTSTFFLQKNLIGNVDQFKETISKYNKEIVDVLLKFITLYDNDDSKRGSVTTGYRGLLELKYADSNTVSFNEEKIKKLKGIINTSAENSQREKNKSSRRGNANRALTFLGLINDIQGEANKK